MERVNRTSGSRDMGVGEGGVLHGVVGCDSKKIVPIGTDSYVQNLRRAMYKRGNYAAPHILFPY